MPAARSFALDVVRRLRDAGYEALWAGGCVRDQLLKMEPTDYDVATDARPEIIRKLFRRTIEVGASFGVVEVLGPKHDGEYLNVQVATFRIEGPYADGRHPDRVEFSTAEADARRRDFTINGMFFDPLVGKVIDYVGGQADLKGRLVRAIGDPRERFAEDKLRLLRAVRFAAALDFQIESATLAAIQAMAEQITVVSAERICEELRRMLINGSRVRAMNLLWHTGLVRPLFPELAVLPESSWPELTDVLGRLQKPSFPLAFAALLHPLGNPVASQICLRFRLSNVERERIAWLAGSHASLGNAQGMKVSKLKRLLAHEGIRELIALHRAESLAANRPADAADFCEEQLAKWRPEEIDPPPLITGNDLICLGLEPGPVFKEMLDRVREAQLEGTVNTKEQALALVTRSHVPRGNEGSGISRENEEG